MSQAQRVEREFHGGVTVECRSLGKRSLVDVVPERRPQPLAELSQRHLVTAEDAVSGRCRQD